MSLKVIQTGTIRSLSAVSYLPSVVNMAPSCIILEIKRDICQTSWFFHTPLYSTPPLGVGEVPSEYCYAVWRGKTRMVCLRDGEKMLMTCLFVLTQLTNVTDTHTDRQTDTHTALLASRGKNDVQPCCHKQGPLMRGRRQHLLWYTSII